MVRQAPVICVMAPPIRLGAWSMALMLWLPFELLCVCYAGRRTDSVSTVHHQFQEGAVQEEAAGGEEKGGSETLFFFFFH